jgi:GNAT superfamily N-acetyltransferase
MEQSVNFQRMLDLADEVFDVANDPDQIDFSENAVEQLLGLHESTLAEHVEGDGPVAWVAVFPTQKSLMHEFLQGQLTEKELLNRTNANLPWECIYLCSALVLPEWRKQGLATKLALESISTLRSESPIEALFAWSFSEEGENLANKIASAANLPCYIRKDHTES